MQAVAAEMNLAGTAFLTPAVREGAHWHLRWFTPKREGAYSGHTTIAAAHALLEAGRLRDEHVVFETMSGHVGATVVADKTRRLIWLEPKVPTLHPFTGQLAHVREAIGLPAAAGWAAAVTTPDHDLVIPVAIVTGSVHSSIGLWLLEAGLLRPAGTMAAFTAEQGDGLGRPGRLRVELLVQDGAVGRVRVGGSAVSVMAGSIARPSA